MGIAIALAQYLAERAVPYDVIEHPHRDGFAKCRRKPYPA
jgi:hypothetical protein